MFCVIQLDKKFSFVAPQLLPDITDQNCQTRYTLLNFKLLGLRKQNKHYGEKHALVGFHIPGSIKTKIHRRTYSVTPWNLIKEIHSCLLAFCRSPQNKIQRIFEQKHRFT